MAGIGGPGQWRIGEPENRRNGEQATKRQGGEGPATAGASRAATERPPPNPEPFRPRERRPRKGKWGSGARRVGGLVWEPIPSRLHPPSRNRGEYLSYIKRRAAAQVSRREWSGGDGQCYECGMTGFEDGPVGIRHQGGPCPLHHWDPAPGEIGHWSFDREDSRRSSRISPNPKLANRQGAMNAKIRSLLGINQSLLTPQESFSGYCRGEIATSYSWRPWRHGGSKFLSNRG